MRITFLIGILLTVIAGCKAKAEPEAGGVFAAKMVGLGDARFTGDATLRAREQAVQIIVEVDSTDPGLYAIAIRSGGCSDVAVAQRGREDVYLTQGVATGGTTGQVFNRPGEIRPSTGNQLGPLILQNAPIGFPVVVVYPVIPPATETATEAEETAMFPPREPPPVAVFAPRERAVPVEEPVAPFDGGTPSSDSGTRIPSDAALPILPDATPVIIEEEPAPPAAAAPAPPRRGVGSRRAVDAIGYVLVDSRGRGHLDTSVKLADAGVSTFAKLADRAVIVQRSPTSTTDSAAYDLVACGMITSVSP